MKLSFILALVGWANVVVMVWLAVFGVVDADSWPAFAIFFAIAIFSTFAYGAKR